MPKHGSHSSGNKLTLRPPGPRSRVHARHACTDTRLVAPQLLLSSSPSLCQIAFCARAFSPHTMADSSTGPLASLALASSTAFSAPASHPHVSRAVVGVTITYTTGPSGRA